MRQPTGLRLPAVPVVGIVLIAARGPRQEPRSRSEQREGGDRQRRASVILLNMSCLAAVISMTTRSTARWSRCGFECGVLPLAAANGKRHSDQRVRKPEKPVNWRQKRLKDRLSQNENHGLLNHSPALSPANSSTQKPFLLSSKRGREIPAPRRQVSLEYGSVYCLPSAPAGRLSILEAHHVALIHGAGLDAHDGVRPVARVNRPD